MSSSGPPPEQPPSGWQPGPPPSGWQPGPPPSGWQPGPPQPPRGQQPPQWQQPAYPQQTLSEQEVKPGRNRKPLYLGLLAAAVLIIGGLVAWQLLKDDGEDTRAAYCAELKDVTHNGNLMSAFSTADGSELTQLDRLHQLAPDAVRDDWDTLQRLFESAQSFGNVDYGAAVKALTAMKAITDDAESECGITMDVPGLP